MALELEIATYNRELANLLSEEGKHVLIHGNDVVDTYVAYEDALKAGYRLFGPDEPFLVKMIESVETIHFISRDVLVDC